MSLISFRKSFGGLLGHVVHPSCVLRDLFEGFVPRSCRSIGTISVTFAVAVWVGKRARPTFRHCQGSFDETLRGVVGAIGQGVDIITALLRLFPTMLVK